MYEEEDNARERERGSGKALIVKRILILSKIGERRYAVLMAAADSYLNSG